MLYSSNNAAKQWILERLSGDASRGEIRILDLACGSGWIWESFLTDHQGAYVTGIDFDKQAIAEGKKRYEGHPRIALRTGDAQHPVETEAYDFVIALSAIEHVVNREAFLKTVYSAIKKGGVAYLNYDAGHFRSRKLKERIMVPLSQMLAAIGFQGSYMKQVEDKVFQSQAEQAGFRVLEIRKHNIGCLKATMRGAPEDAIISWYAFEERLGVLMSPESLDASLDSTTIVLEKV
jgi:cyclopropane fatty-acyl-phospholipid synthase-like methyltransferase